MRPFVRRGGPGLFLSLALALLVAGCAGRSVTSSAQDAALEAARAQTPPPQEQPAVEQPPVQEQPIESAREQPPAAEPQAPPAAQPPTAEPQAPPAEPEPSREQPAETTVPPKAVEEARVTEPEVAPLPQAPPAPAQPPAEQPPQVAAVAPPPPPAPAPVNLTDIFFDFDTFMIRNDAKPKLEENAGLLKKQDGWSLLIEGHCDERGTAAYNLVLGERRAQAARDYLADLGLPASQMKVTSFGKERPFCTEHSYACWQENRRAHFSIEK